MSYSIKQVTTDSELVGIKALQEANLKTNLSISEQALNGFVTASYTLDFLRAMHADAPAIIAVDGGEVVGYALVATRSVAHGHALLQDLFTQIDRQYYNGELLAGVNYVVVGQLCVAKSHRGIGMAQQLYAHFKACFCLEYRYLITDIDTANHRSLHAHQKTGFEVIGQLDYDGRSWDIVLWNWNQ